MDYFRPVWRVVLLVVMLMSGILSLFREFLLIYFPTQVNQQSLLWNCVRIAFVVSMGIIWWQQRQAIAKLQSDLEIAKAKNSPDFELSTATTMISDGVLDYGPQQEKATLILIPTTVINHGAPSIVRKVRLSVRFGDGTEVEGLAYSPRQQFLNFPGPKGPITIPMSSSLFKRATENPIPTGGQADGHVLFRFPEGLRQKIMESEKLILEIMDHTGKEYVVNLPRSTTPVTEFLSTPRMQTNS